MAYGREGHRSSGQDVEVCGMAPDKLQGRLHQPGQLLRGVLGQRAHFEDQRLMVTPQHDPSVQAVCRCTCSA
jgi:hypothetical protein